MHDWALAYLISEWLIRLVMLVYVPQRRPPAAARTWLLLIFVFPLGGMLLYAAVGRARLPRRRIELMNQANELVRGLGREFYGQHFVRPTLPEEFQQVVTLGQNLGDFGIVGGNQFELLPEYEGAIDRLVADIDAAERHVHLMYYIFAADRTGRRVTDAVIRAARRGVVCRVLMDNMGSREALRWIAPDLRSAGVEVIALLPWKFWRRDRARLDLRNHRKIVVIDGQVAYVGSQNIVDADFKPGIIYHELVVRAHGPVAMQLQTVLLTDRYLETQEVPDRGEAFPPIVLGGTSPAQSLPSGPGYPYANNQQMIVALIHAAKHRVVLTTPYFVPDQPLMQAIQTAVLRGVEVHLVVSRKADQVLVGLAQRSYYEELLRSGIHLHTYEHGLLHAKHVSIDECVAIIGSSNLDLRSFQLNAEISLLIYDPRVVEQLRLIETRNFEASHALTLEEWQRRPFVVKVLQNVGRLVDSLL